MDKERVVTYLKLAGAMALVGTYIVVAKPVIARFPVSLSQLLRYLVVAPILIAIAWRHRYELRIMTRRDWLMNFLQAFTGLFLFNMFLLNGLKHTSAAVGGIITSTTPAILALISWVFMRERVIWNQAAGVALALIGILAVNGIALEPGSGQSASTWLGSLLVLGAVTGEASFTVFRKLSAERVSPLMSATLVSTFALILFAPQGIIEALHFDFSAVTWLDASFVLIAMPVMTILAYLFWFDGVTKVSTSTAAIFTGVTPIVAVLCSYVMLGESFQWGHLIGIVCVLAAIGLTSLESMPSKHRAAVSET
ncbi:MAG: DMT family transporter [Anaerolineae bacterium]|nr:DMT family transporter [Anaerolineae bacterium]